MSRIKQEFEGLDLSYSWESGKNTGKNVWVVIIENVLIWEKIWKL
jgi:hypothetical protein